MAKPSSAKTRRRTNKVRRTQTRRGGVPKDPNASYWNAYKNPYKNPYHLPPSTSSMWTTSSSDRSPLEKRLKDIKKHKMNAEVSNDYDLRHKRITEEQYKQNVVRITHLAEEEERKARRLWGKPSIRDRIHGVRTSVRNLGTSAATSARNAVDRARNLRTSAATSARNAVDRARNLGASALESIKNSDAVYMMGRVLDWDHTPDDGKEVKGLLVNPGW
jgi:hypothetical protein